MDCVRLQTHTQVYQTWTRWSMSLASSFPQPVKKKKKKVCKLTTRKSWAPRIEYNIAPTSDDLRAQFTIRYNNNNLKKKKKKLTGYVQLATKQSNAQPIHPPHTYTHVTLFPCPIHLQPAERNSSQTNDIDVNDDYDDMAHLQVYDLPSSQMCGIYTQKSGCPAVRDGPAQLPHTNHTETNRQTVDA